MFNNDSEIRYLNECDAVVYQNHQISLISNKLKQENYKKILGKCNKIDMILFILSFNQTLQRFGI